MTGLFVAKPSHRICGPRLTAPTYDVSSISIPLASVAGNNALLTHRRIGPEDLQGLRPENAGLKKIAQFPCVHVVTRLPPQLLADLLNHRRTSDD